jgi:hypothetical protein
MFHGGPNIDLLKQRDKAYYICEGTTKTTTKEDKSWETTWEGKCQFTGGTGKVKNIKGSLTYKGKATPEQPFFVEGEHDKDPGLEQYEAQSRERAVKNPKRKAKELGVMVVISGAA